VELLDTDPAWQRVRSLPHAVIYKHSPICSLSSVVRPEVQRFETQRPEVPVFMVDVIQQRQLSDQIADDLSLRHESPQAIVLAEGSVEWHGSHRKVSAENLLEAVPA